MMRILIVGATSMIGATLAERLLHQEHQAIAVIRPKSSKRQKIKKLPMTESILCSMEDYGTLSERIKGKVDAAVLLAWNGIRGQARMDAAIQQQNETCYAQLLPELEKLGCHTIMTAGSQAEYGPWYSEQAQSEEAPTCPNTEYGKSKLRFYHMAHAFCQGRGIRLIEPRLFSVYGPNDDENTLVMSLLRLMLKNEPCHMTACVQMWDYVYIDDVVTGLVKLLTEDHPGGVYNFGSGDCRPLKEYVEEIYRITGSRSALHYGAVPYPVTGMVNIHPNVSKLRSTGWTPAVTFAEGIRQILKEKDKRSSYNTDGDERKI